MNSSTALVPMTVDSPRDFDPRTNDASEEEQVIPLHLGSLAVPDAALRPSFYRPLHAE